MNDSLWGDRRFRTFNLVDNFNREGLAIEVDLEVEAVSDQRRPLVSFLLAVVGCSVPFAVILWVWWAHDLHLDVYAADLYWYREEFPTYFKVIVTAVLSLSLGLIAAAVIWIIRYVRRTSD